MKSFTYNSITIGSGGTGTGANTLLLGQERWIWSFHQVTIAIDFTKATTSETDLRSFETAIQNYSTGLIKLAQKLTLTYEDGTTQNFDEAPSGAAPTGIGQNPTVEKVVDETSTKTFGHYKFTIVFELPTNFSGFKLLSVDSTKDEIGFQYITIKGVMPASYINATQDALASFDTYFAAAEKTILNTFMGQNYYKRISGPDLASEASNTSVIASGGGTWKTCNFSVSYRQIAFHEEAKEFVSSNLVRPRLVFQVQHDAILKCYGGSGQTTGTGGGLTPSLSGTPLTRVIFTFSSGILLDSKLLGFSGSDLKKAKPTGVQGKYSGLYQIYKTIVRLYIAKCLTEVFGEQEVAIINEETYISNDPSVQCNGTAILSSGSNTELWRKEKFQMITSGKTFNKVYDGKDFTELMTTSGERAQANYTVTIYSTSPNFIFSAPAGWKEEGKRIDDVDIVGIKTKLTDGGQMSMEPVYAITTTSILRKVTSATPSAVIVAGTPNAGGSGAGGFGTESFEDTVSNMLQDYASGFGSGGINIAGVSGAFNVNPAGANPNANQIKPK